MSVLTGLLFGLAPALQTSRTNLQETLKDGSRSGAADFAGRNVRRGLVVAEMALSLTLLIGAGLLIKSVARLQGVDPGFDPQNVLDVQSRVAGGEVSDRHGADAVPRPADAATECAARRARGRRDVGDSVRRRLVDVELHDRGLRRAAGAERTVGRHSHRLAAVLRRAAHSAEEADALFTDAGHRLRRRRSTVIDEQFVKKYFPNTDPIGKRITFGARRGRTDSTWITIVGVVGHAAHEGLDAEPRIQYYFPTTQIGLRGMTVAIRTRRQSALAAARGARSSAQHRSQPAARRA